MNYSERQFAIRPIFLYKYMNKIPCSELMNRAAVFGYFAATEGQSTASYWVENYYNMNSQVVGDVLIKVGNIINYYWEIFSKSLTCQCLLDKVATASYLYTRGYSLEEAKNIANDYECEDWIQPKPEPYYPYPDYKPYYPNKPDYIPIPIPVPWPDKKPKPWDDHKPKPWHDYVKPKPDQNIIPGLIPPGSGSWGKILLGIGTNRNYHNQCNCNSKNNYIL